MADQDATQKSPKMETLGPHPHSSPSVTKSNSLMSNSPMSAPASVTRLWRPAAQRNLRNQWSKLASLRQQWLSAATSGRAHATSLVNAYLSQRYMPSMELGVLSDMPDIRKKASSKLFKQQELHRSNLLSSYKDLVTVVTHMINTSRAMRCFLKGTSDCPLIQFSSSSDDGNDPGDGGGIPVFTFWSISSFEELAVEFVQMFELELNLKRLLVTELLSINCGVPEVHNLCWTNELYPGEFDDLSICSLYSMETCEPVLPGLRGKKCDMPVVLGNCEPNEAILQVYLTTWLAEVNIDTHRMDEIFAIVGEEMHVTLS